VADSIATLDAIGRERRQLERMAERAERERLEAADTALAEFCDLAETLARAALAAAGYHQHARGDWRQRRD
jgi:hypothetical protein